MRIIGEIPHPIFKVTLFAWNGKYLVKAELGSLEQTYKVDELDYSEDQVRKMIQDEDFSAAIHQQFQAMGRALGRVLTEVD